jgi:hypothetical protein
VFTPVLAKHSKSFSLIDCISVDESLASIVAFYAIVNIPENRLPTVFGEMRRVLKPGGQLLLSFYIGDETVHPDEFLGQRMSMDFSFFASPRRSGN